MRIPFHVFTWCSCGVAWALASCWCGVDVVARISPIYFIVLVCVRRVKVVVVVVVVVVGVVVVVVVVVARATC